MRPVLGVGLCAVAAACALPPPEPAPGPAGLERVYRACPGAGMLRKAANVSWAPAESMTEEHRTLRKRLGLDFPEKGDRVFFFSSGTHHTSVQFTVAAARGPDGLWHVDEAGEEGPGLLRIPVSPIPHKSYDLSASESRRVDALLADPCLRAAPRFMRDPEIMSGGALQTLDIVTARGRLTVSWFGLRTREEERLVNLIAKD
jgi:hypothetical protein